MLYIKDNEGEKTWHVGDPVPKIKGRVVQFQADGHELELFLLAMEEPTFDDPEVTLQKKDDDKYAAWCKMRRENPE